MRAAAEGTRYILVAEPDDSNYHYMQVITRKLNVTLLRTTSGPETIREVRDNPNISLVLMNLMLPQMDGYETAARLHQVRPGIPVVALSTSDLPDSFLNALRAGCCDFITKPFLPQDYVETVNTWLIAR